MNNLFLKKVLKLLPRAINLSVKSFLVAPPAVIFFGLMYSTNFDPQAAGAILSENTKADLAHVWNIIGWISFFTFVSFEFLKSAFMGGEQSSSRKEPTLI